MSKPGSRILKSARQALAYAKGTAETRQYGVHIPERLDVKAIRGKRRNPVIPAHHSRAGPSPR